MSERDQQQPYSPLQSERGSTTIKDSVVQKIAGVAAGEVEGVHMGGTRAAGGLLGGVTGSQSQKRGISVEVGRVETAVDLSMGVDYGRNILELSEIVRNRVTERVESLTGLQVTELNVIVNDVIFPEGEEAGRRGEPEVASVDEDPTRPLGAEELGAGGRRQGAVDTGAPGAARAEAITRPELRFSEETIRAEEAREEDETTEFGTGDERLEEERPPAEEDEGKRVRRREE